MSDRKRCPICGVWKVESAETLADGKCISCQCMECGKYVMKIQEFNLRQGNICDDRDTTEMRSAVMLERNLKGLNDGIRILVDERKGFCFEGNGEAIADYYPKSFRDKLERGFCNLIRAINGSPIRRFCFDDIDYNKRHLLFLDDSSIDEKTILEYIVEEGWLKTVLSGNSVKHYRATTKGMDVYDAQIVNSKQNNAFLAMWFGVEGNALYRDSIRKGVSTAGYNIQVVDQEEYNGFIMDKVINLINDSAFVIADLSAVPEEIIEDGKVKNGVRGGVYWEAGYAAGQKKQVVLTCRDDAESMKRIHFDLQQHNQIRWKVVDDAIVTTDGATLAEAIEQRIRATVGARK